MENRTIDTIISSNRFRRDMGDLAELAESIQRVGLLHPIVVNADGLLIAGARRLAACRDNLGWEEIPVTVVDLSEIVQAEHDENVIRKDFLPSEAVAIAKALEPEIREQGRERQLSTLKKGDSPVVESCHNGERGKTRDKVARYTGMSGRTLEKASQVVAAAEREPEKYRPLVAEMDRTQRVHGVYKKLKVAKATEAIQAEPPPVPTGPFRVIVVDPPWRYEKRSGDPSQRGACPYPAMTIEEIKAIPVGGFSHDDCILWLWTTNAHLPDAFGVIEAWGFTYKTTLSWAKDRIGTGDWLRGQTEHCLMAVKGKPTVRLGNQSTLLHGPLREHSRKPEIFYELVEALCPGAKVELFGRTARLGWVLHGNETDLFAA